MSNAQDREIEAPAWGLKAHVVEATCAKCNYARKATDTAPEWQCPQCGVAYLKSNAAALESAQRRAMRRTEAAVPEDALDARERPSTGKWVAMVVLLLVVALGWQWHHRQSSAREKKAQQEAAARQQQIDAAKRDMQDGDALTQIISEAFSGHAARNMDALNAYAAKGSTQAMVALGRIHLSGYGTARNHEQGMAWLQKAAAEGSGVAMVNLGYIYEMGDGEPRQAELAANWYQRAARQGHASALYSLASMLEHGNGVGQDLRQAYMLYELAARAYNENPNADYMLLPRDRSGLGSAANQINMRKTLSPVDVVKAKEQADAWKVGQPFPSGSS